MTLFADTVADGVGLLAPRGDLDCADFVATKRKSYVKNADLIIHKEKRVIVRTNAVAAVLNIKLVKRGALLDVEDFAMATEVADDSEVFKPGAEKAARWTKAFFVGIDSFIEVYLFGRVESKNREMTVVVK